MSQKELMRLFEEFDGEVSLSDFTPDELARLLAVAEEEKLTFKEAYFAFYDDIKCSSNRRQDW